MTAVLKWNTPRPLCPIQTLCRGLIAKGHKLASGRTANHLVLWDLRPHGLTKSNVEKVCEAYLDDDAGISYDFVVGSQANSCSFYFEATLLKTAQRKTCDGHCGPIVKENVTSHSREYSEFKKGNCVDESSACYAGMQPSKNA